MSNLDSIFKSRDITLPTKVHLVKAMIFQWSCMDVRVGLWRKLSAEELMLLNCGVEEDSWESLGLQGDPTSPFWRSALGLGAREKGDDRGWDGWMTSLTRWTWVWVNSGSWWWTRRPGMLQFMGSQRVGHDWETELNWTELYYRYQKSMKIKKKEAMVKSGSLIKDQDICLRGKLLMQSHFLLHIYSLLWWSYVDDS